MEKLKHVGLWLSFVLACCAAHGTGNGKKAWGTVGFCKIGTDPDCGSGSVSLTLKIVLIIAHCASYVVIVKSLKTTLNRQAELATKGASVFGLMISFIFQVINTDYFIADHIQSNWYAQLDYDTLSMLGFMGVIAAQTALAIAMQGTALKRRMARHRRRWWLENSINMFLFTLLFLDPLFFHRCRILNLLSTIISGAVASYRMYTCLGYFTLKYCVLYTVGGIVGGTASVIVVEVCIQEIHVLAASAFAFSGLMIAKAIDSFRNEPIEDSSSAEEHSPSLPTIEYTAVNA